MLTNLLILLGAMGDVDGGVECVLNKEAKNALLDIISDVYGEHAKTVVGGFIVPKEGDDPKEFIVLPDADDALSLCLTGRG